MTTAISPSTTANVGPQEFEDFGRVPPLGLHLYRVLVTADDGYAELLGDFDEYLVLAADREAAADFAATNGTYGTLDHPGNVGGVELLFD